MSLCGCVRSRLLTGLLLLVFLGAVAIAVQAQEENPPKADIFAGYQWLNPGGAVPVPGTANPVQSTYLPGMSQGFGLGFGYNFHPNFAVEGDFGANYKNGFDFQTYSLGPRATWRGEGVNLFAHTLLSLNHLNTPFGGYNGIGAILGGGFDVKVSHAFSIRVFEADYQWTRQNFSKLVPAEQSDLQHSSFQGVRLRTGVVFNFGGAPPIPPSASCSAQPTEVMVGEPVTVTATSSNFNPKHTVTYTWASTGGKVTSKDNAATIDTAGLAGGSYTATARATDARVKKNNEASCSASFTVKEPPKNPPTMTCSASPTSLVIGGTATITCDCKSPDGVPVSVAGWNASSGSISGTGNSGSLNTAGTSAGTITVNATCTDSRGLTGGASTQVTVENPPPPPVDKKLEARLSLHSVYFPTAQPPVKDPNAGLVASQQQTLIALAADYLVYLKSKPEAHLILEGHADPRGGVAYNQALSERRVARVKSFLVEHGVPDANIETKGLGDQHNLTAAEVKDLVQQNPDLTKEEQRRILRNMQTIILASNRRVDVRLSTTGEVSARQFPFNAADSLTLIGGRQAAKKPAPKAAAPAPKKKAAPKKTQ